MKHIDFVNNIAKARTEKYICLCNGDKRKAVKLYNLNLQLSQTMFAIISLFEVSLRNAIDKTMIAILGEDWIANAFSFGIFYDFHKVLELGLVSLDKERKCYTHDELVSKMEFSFWKNMFEDKKNKRIFNAILECLCQSFKDQMAEVNNKGFSDIVDSFVKPDNVAIFFGIVNKLGGFKVNHSFNSLEIQKGVSNRIIRNKAGKKTFFSTNSHNILNAVNSIVKYKRKYKKLDSNSLINFNETINKAIELNIVDIHKASKLKKAVTNNKVKNFWIRRVFPNLPDKQPGVSPEQFITSKYLCERIKFIVDLRNRIAHHEPICFDKNESNKTVSIGTQYVQREYNRIKTLFEWMGIDASSFLRDVDTVQSVIKRINAIVGGVIS